MNANSFVLLVKEVWFLVKVFIYHHKHTNNAWKKSQKEVSVILSVVIEHSTRVLIWQLFHIIGAFILICRFGWTVFMNLVINSLKVQLNEKIIHWYYLMNIIITSLIACFFLQLWNPSCFTQVMMTLMTKPCRSFDPSATEALHCTVAICGQLQKRYNRCNDSISLHSFLLRLNSTDVEKAQGHSAFRISSQWARVKVCTVPKSYLPFSVPRSPILRILALALTFLLSSVCKFAQQRLRGGCRERKTKVKDILEGWHLVTLQKGKCLFEPHLLFFTSAMAFLFLAHSVPLFWVLWSC